MPMWQYVSDRRLSATEYSDLAQDKACAACGAKILRLAEREPFYPYAWHPTGWVCSACNTVYIMLLP